MAKKKAEKVVDLMAALQASLRGADPVATSSEEGGREPQTIDDIACAARLAVGGQEAESSPDCPACHPEGGRAQAAEGRCLCGHMESQHPDRGGCSRAPGECGCPSYRPNKFSPGYIAASVVGDASEGEACHACGGAAKLVTRTSRGAWNRNEWSDAPEVEYEETRWECACGEAWYSAGQMDHAQLNLLRASLRSTRAALEEARKQRDELLGVLDAIASRAKHDAEWWGTSRDDATDRFNEIARMAEREAYAVRAIPSQESTTE